MTAPNEPNAQQAAPVEMVRKVYARDVREKDRVHTVFRVAEKSRHTARNGKAFLVIVLVDKTGALDARVFDQVDALEPKFAVGDYVLLQGHAIAFHGKPQLVIESVERLDPEPIDAAEFKPPEKPVEKHVERPPRETEHDAAEGEPVPSGALREIADRIGDTHLRAFAKAVLDDDKLGRALSQLPLGRSGPFAHRGGLGEHTLSVARLASRIADHFTMADRDLMLAAALAHALGRTRELALDRHGEVTDEGRLLGAAVLTAQVVHDVCAKLEGFPAALEQHLIHAGLAADGGREPATIEALVLRAAAQLDAEAARWLDVMARDPHERWTDPARLDGHPLWKGPVPTARAKGPLEGRRRRERKRRPDREPGERAERSEKKEASEPKPAIAFKPLAALTGDTPAAEPGKEPSSAN